MQRTIISTNLLRYCQAVVLLVNERTAKHTHLHVGGCFAEPESCTCDKVFTSERTVSYEVCVDSTILTASVQHTYMYVQDKASCLVGNTTDTFSWFNSTLKQVTKHNEK